MVLHIVIVWGLLREGVREGFKIVRGGIVELHTTRALLRFFSWLRRACLEVIDNRELGRILRSTDGYYALSAVDGIYHLIPLLRHIVFHLD